MCIFVIPGLTGKLRPRNMFVYAAGIVALLLVSINFARFIYVNFLWGGVDIKKYAKAKDWAVVTGATDGIGKGYARGRPSELQRR